MSNKMPHKFKGVTNGKSSYDYSIYCEYCGLVAFNANKDYRVNESAQSTAAEGCPCAPVEKESNNE